MNSRRRRRRSRSTISVKGKLYPSESSIQASICTYLKYRGIKHTVTDASVPFVNGRPRRAKVSEPGWPDITGILPGGRFLGIEVKSKYGRLRPVQKKVLQELQDSGGLVFVAKSVDDVREALSNAECS